MKLDGTMVIKKLTGEAMRIDEEPETALNAAGEACFVTVNGIAKMKGGTDLTMERTIREALMSDLDEDKGKPAGKKIERAGLAERLYGATLPVEVSQTEADMILDRVAKTWIGALITYRLDTAITKAKALAQEVADAEKKKAA